MEGALVTLVVVCGHFSLGLQLREQSLELLAPHALVVLEAVLLLGGKFVLGLLPGAHVWPEPRVAGWKLLPELRRAMIHLECKHVHAPDLLGVLLRWHKVRLAEDRHYLAVVVQADGLHADLLRVFAFKLVSCLPAGVVNISTYAVDVGLLVTEHGAAVVLHLGILARLRVSDGALALWLGELLAHEQVADNELGRGDVIDVGLLFVRVANFELTIATVTHVYLAARERNCGVRVDVHVEALALYVQRDDGRVMAHTLGEEFKGRCDELESLSEERVEGLVHAAHAAAVGAGIGGRDLSETQRLVGLERRFPRAVREEEGNLRKLLNDAKRLVKEDGSGKSREIFANQLLHELPHD